MLSFYQDIPITMTRGDSYRADVLEGAYVLVLGSSGTDDSISAIFFSPGYLKSVTEQKVITAAFLFTEKLVAPFKCDCELCLLSR